MKKLLTILLTIISINLYSQNYIGATQSNIVLDKGAPTSVEVIDKNKGMIGAIYVDTDYTEKYVYLDNICVIYVLESNYDNLTYIIKLLNKEYEKVGDVWYYYLRDYKIKSNIDYYEDKFQITFIMVFYEKS